MFTGALTAAVVNPAGIPATYELHQNFPNPFNPATTIHYRLPSAGIVKLAVYDVLGREASVLVNERKEPGNYEAIFDGSGFSGGVYFYRLQAGDFIRTKRLVLMK